MIGLSFKLFMPLFVYSKQVGVCVSVCSLSLLREKSAKQKNSWLKSLCDCRCDGAKLRCEV